MSTSKAGEPEHATQTSTTPAWRRTRVIAREDVIDGVELVDAPGTCAACRRAFRVHSDAELRACAAAYEPTLSSGLQPDDRVVKLPSASLADGKLVEIVR